MADSILKQSGWKLGQITDGDSWDRPNESLEECLNMDFDIEAGEIQTRNSTVDSGLLGGFTMPSGYEIMPDGLKLFSFNEPVGREVALLFIKNNVTKDVKIYVNCFFNPPAPSGLIDYENYVSTLADGWIDQWIELTEKITLTNVKINLPLKIIVDGALDSRDNYYRGWFIWNKTKSDSSVSSKKIQNESFVCIESFNHTTKEFTIQNRTYLTLTDLAWNDNDECYLIRYPVVIHKHLNKLTDSTANWDEISTVKIIKTNISCKILIGQAGNLWFGFNNKDTTVIKDTGNNRANIHRYYGWWLDYAQYPVITSTELLDANITYYTDSRIGIEADTELPGGSGAKLIAVSILMDFTQRICIFKLFNDVAKAVGVQVRFFHHYSRRIIGSRIYSLTGTVKESDDPIGYLQNREEPFFYVNTYIYIPIYTYFTNPGYLVTEDLSYPKDDISLDTRIGYSPSEQIYNSCTMGVYAQGRLFESGDIDKPDNVKYSSFQRRVPTEDIMPLQNNKPIDSTDKDKNTGMELLGINPTVFKQQSTHIIGIEGQPEVNWRLQDAKSRIGTNIPRSIIRTPYGIMFANYDGIFLLQVNGEFLNILSSRRLIAYLSIIDKSIIYAEWYSKDNEAWFYVGGNQFWIVKLSKESASMGWKTYQFNFTPIDLTTDEEGRLLIIGNNFIYRYKLNWEVTNGKDADNTGISWLFRPNFITVGRYEPFHHIETLINFEQEIRNGLVANGNYEIMQRKVYKEGDVIVYNKQKQWNVSVGNPESISIKNDKSNRQRAIKFELSGTLDYLKRIKFTEMTTRIVAVPKQVKSGYEFAE